MGLLQKACQTYDEMEHRAGKRHEREAEPLAPVSHTVTRAAIEITLNQQGEFISARAVEKEEPKIIIPVTEESTRRTSTAISPHALCDQLGYVCPYRSEKYKKYIQQLEEWADSDYSHPKLGPILRYVRGGGMLRDLSEAGVIQLTPEGAPKDEKQLVCWIVNGLGEENSGPCWTDKSLMDAFTAYYASRRAGDAALCMISGEKEIPSQKHPKGIIANHSNAKLISANDPRGFTYRGRFLNDEQAATVGYSASQKAHNALQWLAANQGVSFGGRTFLCWNPRGIPVPSATGSLLLKKADPRPASPTQYRQQLLEALTNWKNNLPAQEGVVVAVFDAATDGRLSLVYYNELMGSDFLQRLYDWEDSCRWGNDPYREWSPSLSQIVSWAFGTLQNGKPEVDNRIRAQQMQRLAACRLDKRAFPLDILRALVKKASNLQVYDRDNRRKLLFTACAAIRKYHYDHWKEEWDMALDLNNTNRSYLFGRLLAVADVVESSTYERADQKKRETNAMRMQRAFSLRPVSTWRMLWEKLGPYFKRLSPGLRQYYQDIAQEIVDKLPASDIDLNQSWRISICWGTTTRELIEIKNWKRLKRRRNKEKQNMGILKNKIDFIAFAAVTMANPNGDPLSGNSPRTDYAGLGEMSDVCIKRKLRNRMQDLGQAVFVQSADRRDDGCNSLKERADAVLGKVKDGKDNREAYAKKACETWLDVRSFGQLFAFTDKENDTKGVSTSVRGPVSIHQAVSVSPVQVEDMKITKSVNGARPKNGGKGPDTMGTKSFVRFGFYQIKGSVNVQLAGKTGFTEQDAQVLKECLRTLFVNDASSARPEGSMEIVKLYWFRHNCEIGQYSSAKVHRSVRAQLKNPDQPPTCAEDYEIVLEPLEGLEPEIIDGV